jgi:hypothetical protein
MLQWIISNARIASPSSSIENQLYWKGCVMKSKNMLTISIVAVVFIALGGTAFSAQDRYTLQVPGGLAFTEFRGYEKWQVVSASQSGDVFAVILVNPVMIDAYLAGVPGNGKPFPDGSKMAKIHWKTKKSAEAPAPTTVPDTLHDVDFMVRDSKRFSNSGNWGYAEFDYDPAPDAFKPNGSGAGCGFACHTIVAKKDYVFTAYPKR